MSRRPDGPRRRLAEWKRTAVWRLLAPGSRLVLDKMADYGNTSGATSAAIRTLARACGCHQATVQRALAQAKAVGILVPLKQESRQGKRGPGSVHYRVDPAVTDVIPA